MAVLEIRKVRFQERDFTLPVEQKTEIKIEDLCVEFRIKMEERSGRCIKRMLIWKYVRVSSFHW